jgi:hypothetical protein
MIGKFREKGADIEPCPFCGQQAKLNYTLGKAYIECVNPDCKIAPSTWLRVNEDKISKLIAVWNRRSY